MRATPRYSETELSVQRPTTRRRSHACNAPLLGDLATRATPRYSETGLSHRSRAGRVPVITELSSGAR